MVQVPEDEKRITSELLDNVPNPSNDRTTIYYNLAKGVNTGIIRVTDIRGKIVANLPVTNGSNSIEIDCSQYSPGIYFNSLVISEKIINTKKMVITK